MRLQRMAILFLVLALVVGLEVLLMSRCTTTEETLSVTPSAIPQSTTGSVPTPTAIPTIVPTMPGFTSPPAGGVSTGGNTGSSGGNNNSSGNNNNNNSSRTSAPQPTATPKPTDAPPPTQAPGTNLGSGSFSSDTGTNLNISVSWEARDQGNGKCRVYITGTVKSYSLNVGSRPISISFGGYSTSVNGSSLNVASGGGIKNSSLFSTYLDVPAGTEGTMTVSWRYNGTYSEVPIETVTASGTVYTS